jgi:hypothetical protein
LIMIIHMLYKMQRIARTYMTSSAPLKCKWELEGLQTEYNYQSSKIL